MFFAPAKAGKKVATVNNSLDQFKKARGPGSRTMPAWQQKLMNKTTETKAAPKSKAPKSKVAPKSKKVEEKKAEKSGFKWGRL